MNSETKTTFTIDVPAAARNILGDRPWPGHEKITEEIEKGLIANGITVTDADHFYILAKALDFGRTLDAPVKKVQSTTPQRDRLESILYQRLGQTNWNAKELTLTIRAADLAWLITVAEWGIVAQEELFRKESVTGQLDIGEMLSVADWKRTVAGIVDQAEAQLKPKSKPIKKTTGDTDVYRTCFVRHACSEFWDTSYPRKTLTEIIQDTQRRTEEPLNATARDRLLLVVRDLNALVK